MELRYARSNARLRLSEGEPGEVRTDAYHGTNLTSALSILSTGFIPHLEIAGVGVYFDLENDSSARQRAWEKADDDPSQAVIIRAEVHLGRIIEINFRYNPVIASEFVRFQMELKKQLGVDIPLNFNQQKDLFIQERYPDVNSVSYFDIVEQQLTVAVRHPERIKILSAMTLTRRS